MTIKGSTTTCPRCGLQADIQDGDYSLENDVLEYLSGPGVTFDALRAAAEIVRSSQAAGESPERTIERAAVAIPALSKLKGKARSTVAWIALTALAYLGGKFADKWVDPLVKPPEMKPAELQAIVKDALEQALKQRADAAAKAGIVDPSPSAAPSPPAPRDGEVGAPRFPKSMEKLQRQMRERYSNQRVQRPLKREERNRDPGSGPDDAQEPKKQ
ncbi:hypothetical protein [Variovorax sp. CY25R-8]|uniref:hypothetical protein n=1 Tax=Variovorax sp. CY25R-8 TaxID=2855501 RepID=UPI0021BB3F77|nr:hypothetical protein [Variovorax sp. CY25R-8]MCT8178130.1 hypothetical protein [Variovorax sp. CY25R-8]